MKNFLLLITLILSPTLKAQEIKPYDIPPWSAKVFLRMDVDEEVSEIASFIRRELRDIKGVEIVEKFEDEFDWELSIIAVAEKINGKTVSVPFAALVLKRWNPPDSYFSKEMKDSIQAYSKILVRVEDHAMWGGPKENIRSNCEKIVARFDSEQLEPARQSYEAIRKSVLERAKETPPKVGK